MILSATFVSMRNYNEMKSTNDFTITLVSDESPRTVFNAIRNVRQWWSGYYSEKLEGDTDNLNDEFTFLAGGGEHFSRQRLTEVVPDKKIVWLVTESKLNFLEQKDEWTGTRVIFDISQSNGKTYLTFTHQGLHPEVECYEACAPAWTQYLQNRLRPMIHATTL